MLAPKLSLTLDTDNINNCYQIYKEIQELYNYIKKNFISVESNEEKIKYYKICFTLEDLIEELKENSTLFKNISSIDIVNYFDI